MRCVQDSLGDTHGVVAVADQRLAVVLPLRPHRDDLQRVGSSAELAVDRLHAAVGAVGQVEAAHGLLGDGGAAEVGEQTATVQSAASDSLTLPLLALAVNYGLQEQEEELKQLDLSSCTFRFSSSG